MGVLVEHLPYPLLLRQEKKMCWMTMERKNERLADWSFHLYRTVLLALHCYLLLCIVSAWTSVKYMELMESQLYNTFFYLKVLSLSPCPKT